MSSQNRNMLIAHDSLGYDDGSGAIVDAGSAEILHVITKPVAAPGERQVTQTPEELRVLREHPWDQPLPHHPADRPGRSCQHATHDTAPRAGRAGADLGSAGRGDAIDAPPSAPRAHRRATRTCGPR